MFGLFGFGYSRHSRSRISHGFTPHENRTMAWAPAPGANAGRILVFSFVPRVVGWSHDLIPVSWLPTDACSVWGC